MDTLLPQQHDECIFCKIISGLIPSHKIYEDEHVYAFLDIAEDFDGHTLVIPKKHCTNILDCPSDELAQVSAAVQKIARHYTQNCGFEGVNILSFAESCAGQTVFHLHFHILPRKKNDGGFVFPKTKNCTHSLADMCKKLKL
ncbi:MAG: HIT family protein [Treponemataceae bacterium]|nr:MAG: HIT family protein [Treponemataceae bacterium]